MPALERKQERKSLKLQKHKPEKPLYDQTLSYFKVVKSYISRLTMVKFLEFKNRGAKI